MVVGNEKLDANSLRESSYATGIPDQIENSENYLWCNDYALRKVSLMICHVTESCNLSCAYCSAAALSKTHVEIMSLDIIAESAKFIFERSARQEIGWIFFGGEPLLASLDWLRQAREITLAEATERNRGVHFGMQTNGTLISAEVADFLAEIQLRPSVSLDGPPHIHNTLRQDAQRTIDGIRRLIDRDLTPTVLTVMGPHIISCVDEVIDFFISLGLQRTKFNMYQCAGRATGRHQVTPQNLAEARFHIVSRVLSEEILDVNVAAMLHRIVHSAPVRPDDFRACGAPHCGGGLRHLAVSTKGRLYPCDRCQADSICELGSIHRPLDNQTISSRILAFHQDSMPSDRCSNCPAWRICHSCCTAYRGLQSDVDTFCQASRLLWPRLEANVDRIEKWTKKHPLLEINARPTAQSSLRTSAPIHRAR